MLPSSCLVFEQDFARITRDLDGVIGVPARLLITDCDAQGLESMNAHVDLAVRQLETADPDVVVYMCTSGSFMNGNAGDLAIRRRLTELTGRRSMTTSSAVLAALRALDLRRVVMLTPYDEDLTRREIDWLVANGIEVTDHCFRDIPDNLDRGAQPPDELLELATKLAWQSADGVFLSCGNVPSLDVLATLEAHTGKPAVGSSQATIWMALHVAGVHPKVTGFGSLFDVPYDDASHGSQDQPSPPRPHVRAT